MPRGTRMTEMARNASVLDIWRPAGCMIALTLLAGMGAAQTGPAVSLSNTATAGAQGISYTDGQLTIHVFNTTLAEVLGKVARLTGVTIELPPGAGVEKMQIVELGPGPARQILAALLAESNFDYLIQASDNDSDTIQSVLLMPRGKKDPTSGGIPVPGNGPRAFRAAMTPPPPEEPPTPAPEPPAPPVPENLPTAGPVSVAPNSPPPQPQAPSGAQPAYAPLDPSALPPQSVLDQPLPNGLNADPTTTRPGALTPPPVINQQTITQQLQQMYQTRAQMNQAARPQ